MESPFAMEVFEEPKVFFLTARRIMYCDRPPGEVLSKLKPRWDVHMEEVKQGR